MQLAFEKWHLNPNFVDRCQMPCVVISAAHLLRNTDFHTSDKFTSYQFKNKQFQFDSLL